MMDTIGAEPAQQDASAGQNTFLALLEDASKACYQSNKNPDS
jgi:hypothetical protein